MTDVERWAEWTSSVRSIKRLDDGALRVGSRARVFQLRLLPAVWQVTVLKEGSGFTWVTRSPGVVATGDHWVQPIEGGSRATLTIRYDGALGGCVAWLTRNLNDRYLGLEAAGLKRRSEGESRD